MNNITDNSILRALCFSFLYALGVRGATDYFVDRDSFISYELYGVSCLSSYDEILSIEYGLE
ncbi:MAG: hypothetical protein WC656_03240 [Sulfurimonas sp.]|jgi:hypothetical protein